MTTRDLHQSLKSEQIGREKTKSGVDLALVKMQWGKQDTALSLHAHPNSFTPSGGLQTSDFLFKLGFKKGPCPFLDQCYARFVPDDVNLNRFANAFDDAYQKLAQAEKHLQACGYFLQATEGISMYNSRTPFPVRKGSFRGNGHTSSIPSQLVKESFDDIFQFEFTWILNNQDGKGWTIHYRPQHLPLSAEIENVLSYLGIKRFNECPQFDFEFCYWTFFAYSEEGDGFFNSHNESVHRYFENHRDQFSAGIKLLLEVQAIIETVNLDFLPMLKAEQRVEKSIKDRIVSPLSEPISNITFDVAISFAGSDRMYAEEIATKVRAAGFTVFYDDFYPEDLWGKDLAVTFGEIYSKRARFCLILVSNEYNDREWTIHERSSALSRMIKEKGKEYILPVKIDNISLPGLPDTIGYISIDKGTDFIANLLVKKFQA